MNGTISMTDILLTVSVGCNLCFLFLLLYDRIMETRLVRCHTRHRRQWRQPCAELRRQRRQGGETLGRVRAHRLLPRP